MGRALPGTNRQAHDDPTIAYWTRVPSGTALEIPWLLQRGDVVAKTLPTDEKREVVALTVSRIAIPPDFYGRKFQDIVDFKKSDAVITVVLEDEGAEGTPTNYLVYLNRSRTLDLAGSFSGLRRRIVEGRTKDGMEKNMRYMKARLEAMYRTEMSSQ